MNIFIFISQVVSGRRLDDADLSVSSRRVLGALVTVAWRRLQRLRLGDGGRESQKQRELKV